MKPKGRRKLRNRWRGILLIGSGLMSCLVVLTYLVSRLIGGNMAPLLEPELSAIACAELVGTSNCQNQSGQAPPVHTYTHLQNLLSFGQPVTMLKNQLLPVAYESPPHTERQSSLFQSVQQFGQVSERLVMGWIPYTGASQTIHLISANRGLTVASPQWLSVKNSSGDITNRTEPSVVKYAHANHIQIYALVDNQFNASLTHQVLTDDIARSKLISNLVQAATKNHLDGLNIDFENLKSADEQAYTQFISELHKALAGKNVVLSVDITPDIQFLKDDAAFFHAALSKDADYVVLMAYDEHWSTDQTPGPVADLPWVTTSINDLLDTGVPADKLVLGIPFYARFWHVHQDGSVDSEAYPIAQVPSILSAHQATSTWKSNLGVAYAKYDKPDGYEEVWYSTQTTIHEELKLVQDNNLAGVSIWSLSLSDPNNWSSLVHGIMQVLS